MNNITIEGNVGKDAELKYTKNGTPVANFSVASSDYRNGEYVTTWFRSSLWGKQAEALAKRIVKGTKVFVYGPMVQETFTNDAGEVKTSLVVETKGISLIRTDSAPGATASDNAAPTQTEIPLTGETSTTAPF